MSSSTVQQSVREQALALPEGCSIRGVCPKCGSTTAFSMTRAAGEVRYICFSASCGCRGVIASKYTRDASLEQKVIKNRKLFVSNLTVLETWEVDWLANKFNIEEQWLSCLRYCEEDKRVYCPQYDVTGRIQGYIARYYPELAGGDKLKGAKALWKAVLPTDVCLCFPTMEVLAQVAGTKQLIVVEDYMSALRMNSQLGVPTCCLGGTSIYASHISTMIALDVKELVIVLDADATTKAIKLKRSLSLTFNRVMIVPLLGYDIKDMSINEFDKTFQQLRG